ncbi:hypothetical protein CDD80_7386 [Ophiocordyceps camponoti-rufipedis]|uniref:AB hydrolase-1 domain-containing protein n=1 Tax=Ophiocordyceps camponoti-rufipedis TaxID=2004952 RepID=A0A2C5ZDZ6_9HYPO|nr:hypothetical protein CDD80_7386 [Ophiocordyceps camponoti-rufipedis]
MADAPPPPDRLLPASGSDPRSRSTQSLVPDGVPEGVSRRLLLVVYIHGFYGNAQSFGSFPAHVHALLRDLVADSHVVHTKIYPRYKTYRAIDVARDNLGAWLEPHQSPDTDVVLVGHSMGGLLAAELALMTDNKGVFRHRILGTLSLDSPFLGLHPRIVAAGISSLFQPAQDADETAAEPAPEPAPTPSSETDPYFDPPYWNDEPFREQPFLRRFMHFTSKHRSEGFFNALRNHVVSHLEFGGCLADYPGLVSRYEKLRALEDVDEVRAASGGSSATVRRVRFANYYTLCSGRPKAPKRALVDTARANSEMPTSEASVDDNITNDSPEALEDASSQQQEQKNEHPEDTAKEEPDGKSPTSEDEESQPLVLTCTPPPPPTPPSPPAASTHSSPAASKDEPEADLDPIPDEPTKPEPPDLEQFAPGPARKQAEKEAKQARRAYDEAIKDRAKAIRRREKLLERQRKEAKREAEKQQREADKQQRQAQKAARRREKEEAKAAASSSSSSSSSSSTATRKFCALPRGVSAGRGDATWIDVYLDGVDEVGAHCGLFVATAAHYDALVGDVGSRIAAWVGDSLSARAVLGEST